MNLAKHWAATLDDYVIDLAWSPDGSLLAAASAAGGVALAEAATGQMRKTIAAHADGTNCVAWRPGPAAALVATGGQDGCVRLWSGSGEPVAEYQGGSAWVEHLAWQPAAGDAPQLFAAAGRRLVALGADGTLQHAFPDAPKTIAALAWRNDGRVCAAATFGSVCLWEASTRTAAKEFAYGNAILALTWSPNDRWLVAGCHDNAVHLWAPAEDEELHMSGYESKLRDLSFSPDSKWLATGGGRDACVWDCSGAGPANREPLTLPHEDRVVAVAFQHRHNVVATGAANGEFALWAPTHRNPLQVSARLPSAPTRIAWSPDDSLVAVGTASGAVFVFRA